jgi:hypothetical protein
LGNLALATLRAVDDTFTDAGTLVPHLAIPTAVVHDIGVGNGLGKGRGDELPHTADLTVELIRHSHRTHLGALSTTFTFFLVHVAGFLEDGDRKVARFALDFSNDGVGEELDVGMCLHLVHLGRFDADRAIICRERLVQPRHETADG